MKYIVIFIFWIFFLFYLNIFLSADSWNIIDSSSLTIVNQNSWFSQNSEYIKVENTWEWMSWSFTPILFGDLQIVEVFPWSGNCLDEYIRIVSHRDFSWYIEIIGAWVSSWSIQINVNLISWERLIITDNIAGMKTTDQVILVPSITLTNGWEMLQLRYSWLMLDTILYSDPRAAKSLIFTEWVWWIRYFKTIVDAQLQSSCSLLISEIIHSPVVWWCTIDIKNSEYRWSGYYILSLEIWSLSWCINQPLNKRYDKEKEIAVWVCQTYVEVGPWVHHLIYYWYSDTWSIICSDDLYFASQYDVWYIQIQDNSPWQCQNTKTNTKIDNSSITFYESKNCGIELQSPKLLFTTDSALNVRLLLDGTWLNDSQKMYSCVVDFGNGEKIQECNPSAFHYQLPWIYTIWIHIKDSNTGQPICTHTSFLYVPAWLKIKNTINWLNFNLSWNWSSSWSNFNCTWIFSGFYIYSLLPNPKGSDSWQELIVFSWVNDLNFSNVSLKIGKKTINLSEIMIWQNFTLKSSLWLLNKWMCIDLIENNCGIIQHVCYDKVKDDEILYCSTGMNALCIYQDDGIKEIKKISETLSCSEKIQKLKADQKNSLAEFRNKQKKIITQLRIEHNSKLKKYKDKERISRNSFYAQERWFALIEKTIKNWWNDSITYMYDIKSVMKFLIREIKSNHFILSKAKTTNLYMYDVQKYLKLYFSNDSFLSVLFPDVYMDSVYMIISGENK